MVPDILTGVIHPFSAMSPDILIGVIAFVFMAPDILTGIIPPISAMAPDITNGLRDFPSPISRISPWPLRAHTVNYLVQCLPHTLCS